MVLRGLQSRSSAVQRSTRQEANAIAASPIHARSLPRLAVGSSQQAPCSPACIRSHCSSRDRVRSRASMPVPVVMTVTASNSKDLLVMGPGVLGSYAGKLWHEANPQARVVGVTNTTNNHERLSKMGLHPVLKGSLPAGDSYPYVLYCAPPSGAPDYAADVGGMEAQHLPGVWGSAAALKSLRVAGRPTNRVASAGRSQWPLSGYGTVTRATMDTVASALALWDSTLPGSSFVFTSSMSVCSVDDGRVVGEDCPLVARGAGPSTDKLLAAEELVLKAGGNVVRLVGLYHAQRGAHTYFLKTKEVPRPGDYVVNLLHYEDAADLAAKVLAGAGTGPFRQRVFLGCDNVPVTFRGMIDSCLASPLFAGQGPVTWTVPDQGPNKSKSADNTVTRQALGGWQPKYASFDQFMRQHSGEDFYVNSGLF